VARGSGECQKFLGLDRDFWHDVFAPIGKGPLEGANPVEIRAIVALAATLVCAAIAAHAASPVQTAREQQLAPLAMSLDDPTRALPENPLGIEALLGATGDPSADPLAIGTPTVELYLGATDAAARDPLAMRGQFEVNPLDM
jgi:hypothetical protein